MANIDFGNWTELYSFVGVLFVFMLIIVAVMIRRYMKDGRDSRSFRDEQDEDEPKNDIRFFGRSHSHLHESKNEDPAPSNQSPQKLVFEVHFYFHQDDLKILVGSEQTEQVAKSDAKQVSGKPVEEPQQKASPKEEKTSDIGSEDDLTPYQREVLENIIRSLKKKESK